MALRDQRLTEAIIGAAIEVHRALGPGLLESAYQTCLAHEFGLRRIQFAREKPLPLANKGVELDCGYRTDFVVDDRIALELRRSTVSFQSMRLSSSPTSRALDCALD